MPKSKVPPRRKHKHKKTNKINPNKSMDRYNRKVKKMTDDQQAEEIYINAKKMIEQAAQMLSITRSPHVRNNVDTDALDRLIIVFSKDLIEFKKQLDNIRAEHLEVKNEASKQDRLFAYLAVADKYNQLMDNFNVVVTPSMLDIYQIVETAESTSNNHTNNQPAINGAML